MNNPKKLLAISVLVALVSGCWLAFHGWANETGYCLTTNSFNDKSTILRLAIQNELPFMRAFGKTDGYEVDAGPAYDNVDDLIHVNPVCCELDPDVDSQGRIEIGPLDRWALGWTHGLTISWQQVFVDENRKKRFPYLNRDDAFWYQKNFLKNESQEYFEKIFLSNESKKFGFRGSILKVSNCGIVSPAKLGNWFGRT